MKVFMLLAFIPSLITANILCPNSKTTCPIDKKCCEVDGEYSCCDLEDDQDLPDTKLKVYAGVEIKSSAPMAAATSLSANESILYWGGCDFSNCPGKCCSNSYDGCCPERIATCCGNGCCAGFGTCCGNGCCGSLQKCCRPGKCCGTLQECCSDGCCDFGFPVCCGKWCCKKGSRCGSTHRSCISKGAIISPEIVALLMTAANTLQMMTTLTRSPAVNETAPPKNFIYSCNWETDYGISASTMRD